MQLAHLKSHVDIRGGASGEEARDQCGGVDGDQHSPIGGIILEGAACSTHRGRGSGRADKRSSRAFFKHVAQLPHLKAFCTRCTVGSRRLVDAGSNVSCDFCY